MLTENVFLSSLFVNPLQYHYQKIVDNVFVEVNFRVWRKFGINSTIGYIAYEVV